MSRTPTEALVLDVLAARTRLGETSWPFDTALRPTLRRMEAAGLIGFGDGVAGGLQAFLTEAGKAEALSPTYTPPELADDLRAELAAQRDLAEAAARGFASARDANARLEHGLAGRSAQVEKLTAEVRRLDIERERQRIDRARLSRAVELARRVVGESACPGGCPPRGPARRGCFHNDAAAFLDEEDGR